jgi:hypothetical protein
MATRFKMDAVDKQTSTANQILHQRDWNTQYPRTSTVVEKGRTKTPNIKSAHARDAMNIFVTDRSFSDVNTAMMTKLFPRTTAKLISIRIDVRPINLAVTKFLGSVRAQDTFAACWPIIQWFAVNHHTKEFKSFGFLKLHISMDFDVMMYLLNHHLWCDPRPVIMAVAKSTRNFKLTWPYFRIILTALSSRRNTSRD